MSKLIQSLFNILLFVTVEVNSDVLGAIAIVKGFDSILTSFKKVFHTTHTMQYDVNHPLSCADSCGFEYLNQQYSKSRLMKSESQLPKHILSRFEGTAFEEEINKHLTDDISITFNNGSFERISFIYESSAGDIGAFFVGWTRMDESVPGNHRSIQKARKVQKLPDDEPFYDTFIMIQEVSFQLAKLRMIVHHTKSSFFQDSAWSEIIYIEPTLTEDVMKSLMMGIVHPVMRHYQQIGINPPEIPQQAHDNTEKDV